MSQPQRFLKVRRYGVHTHVLPMLSRLSHLCMCGPGLCPSSGVICDLLLRVVEGALLEEYLVSQS